MFPGLCRPRGVRAFVVPELKIVKQHIYVFHAIGGRHPYGHCAGRSRAGHRPRRVAAFVQPPEGRGLRVRHPDARTFVDAVQGGLLPLRHPLPDVRRRDGVPLFVGRRRAGTGRLRTGEHSLLFGGTDSGPCLRMAERSFGRK